jgi:hypothetical protein
VEVTKLKCGCVYATADNEPAVRHGIEMGGYVKKFCTRHAPAHNVEAPLREPKRKFSAPFPSSCAVYTGATK